MDQQPMSMHELLVAADVDMIEVENFILDSRKPETPYPFNMEGLYQWVIDQFRSHNQDRVSWLLTLRMISNKEHWEHLPVDILDQMKILVDKELEKLDKL